MMGTLGALARMGTTTAKIREKMATVGDLSGAELQARLTILRELAAELARRIETAARLAETEGPF